MMRFEYPCCQHGREGKRNKSGNKDGPGDHDGEFAKKPSRSTLKKYNRGKDCHEGNGGGNYRKKYLSRSFYSCFQGRHALLHFCIDIFKDNDGIVHHKTNG